MSWISILVSVFISVVFLGLPAVAFPFAHVLKHGRQAIDNRINWRGSHAERSEAIEDGFTYSMAFLLGVVIYLVPGATYLWYAARVMPFIGWLSGAFQILPSVTVPVLGDVSLVVALFWTIAYWVWFVLGWRKR